MDRYSTVTTYHCNWYAFPMDVNTAVMKDSSIYMFNCYMTRCLKIYLVSIYTRIYIQLYPKCNGKKGIRLSYIKRTSGQRSGWFRYNMTLNKYKDCDAISFCCYAELSDIKRTSDVVTKHNITSLKSRCTFQWDVDQDTLNAFKVANQGQCFYSPNFNNGCFCLVVIPQGRVTDPVGSLRTFVKMLKLPSDVDYAKCQCTLKVVAENEDNQEEYSLHERLGFGIGRRHAVASSTLFYSPTCDIFDSAVGIKVSMEITEIYDADRESIHKTKWSEFNVIELPDIAN
eukprot:29814_1